MLATTIGIACGVAAVLLLRALRRSRQRREEHDVVDVAVEESFPASDPPAWTTGRH